MQGMVLSPCMYCMLLPYTAGMLLLEQDYCWYAAAIHAHQLCWYVGRQHNLRPALQQCAVCTRLVIFCFVISHLVIPITPGVVLQIESNH